MCNVKLLFSSLWSLIPQKCDTYKHFERAFTRPSSPDDQQHMPLKSLAKFLILGHFRLLLRLKRKKELAQSNI